MKHSYLSQNTIDDALKFKQITSTEAKKLKKKIDTQVAIFKSIHKH